MLYKKIHFVGLAIYATLSRTTFGSEYVAYAKNSPNGCRNAGPSDKCTFYCDEKDGKFNSDFQCDAGICDIYCEQRRCFEHSDITATDSQQLNVYGGGSQLCYQYTTIHLPSSGSANFYADSTAKDPFQHMTVIAGSNTQDIYINCAGGDGKTQCTAMEVQAQNAQSLHINVNDAKLQGHNASIPMNIYCPHGITEGGSNGAPCYINSMNKATLKDITVHTVEGFPYALYIDVDDAKNWDNLVVTCSENKDEVVDKNILLTDEKKNGCYNTRAPTTASPTPSPTPAPTANPTPAPTSNPTLQPTSIPTVAPSRNPTKLPTVYTVSPTKYPTFSPSSAPTISPTSAPTVDPTASPSSAPTMSPTYTPTFTPSQAPSASPTGTTNVPTYSPTIITTEADEESLSTKIDRNLLVVIMAGGSLIIIACIVCLLLLLRILAKKEEPDPSVIHIVSHNVKSTEVTQSTQAIKTGTTVHIKHSSANELALAHEIAASEDSDLALANTHFSMEANLADNIVQEEGDDYEDEESDDDEDVLHGIMETAKGLEVVEINEQY